MRKGPIILGIALVLAGVAVVSAKPSSGKPEDQLVTGIPATRRLTSRPLGQNEAPTGQVRIGPAVLLLDGQPVPTNDLNRARELSRQVHAVWDLRKTVLPGDADRLNTDVYSKELYWVPSWLAMIDPDKLDAATLKQAVNGVPIDEFGRTKPGHFGQEDNSLWGQTLGGLLKNPLFKSAVMIALVASGPGGLAAIGAYTMWENRGRELTASNALLVAGKTYAVSQCGVACGVAFEFGVGVASGKSVDRAAEDALYQEMTPEQRVYYNEGKKLVRS